MAERTIRKRNGRNTATVIRAGESAPNDAGESVIIAEPDAGESDELTSVATIDDYDVSDGSDGNGEEFVDPASAGTGSNSDTGRKRRSDAGTRRGSRTRRTSATETTNSVASMLFTLHLGMATFLKSEYVALSEDESQNLAKAITRVTQLYDIPVMGEKAMAWTNLLMVAGTVYGPRIVAGKVAKKKHKPQVVEFVSNLQPQEGAK